MKKNISKKEKNLRILICIIVILIIIMAIMMFINRFNLDPTSDKVNKIYNYFNTKDLTNCEGLINYSDKIVKSKNISEETKLCIAYNKIENLKYETDELKASGKNNLCKDNKMTFAASEGKKVCNIKIIEDNIINNLYKKIFGKNPGKIESFKVNSNTICYLKDDKYYCGESEVSEYYIGTDSHIYRVIRDAKEKSGEIIIRDFFIKMSGNACLKYYTTSEENKECSENYNKDTKIDYRFMKKYGTQYKHTYKQDKKGNYYWYSSEPIK